MPSKKQYYELEPSTLETIDYAVYDFINDKMNNFSTKNEGWKKVPILWVSAERSFLSKNDKDIIDLDGALKLPIVSIERTSIRKDLNRKGAYFGNPVHNFDPTRGGRIVISRRIVNDKTNNFAAADNIKSFGDVNRTPGKQAYFPSTNKKIVYETITMPAPVYLSINYDISIRSQYIQQMNELTAPFMTLGGHINSFLIKRGDHKYETFVQSDFSYNNNVSNMGENERTYETKVTFDVLGYIMGESPNGDRPRIIKTQNAVEVKIPREHVILGDIPPYNNGKGFYKE
jgi:hypothetical protein